MMKQLVFTILVLGCLSACASRTYACFCVTPEVPEALKHANAVFLGEVIEIVEPKTSSEGASIQDRFFTIKFKIEKSWKGVPFGTREFNILAAQGRYGCFAFPPMNKGERYLVYADPAYGAEHWSVVTICNRTTIVRFASNPRLLNPEAIDPFWDIKQLDVITKRAFTFNSARSRRRV
jgi:hypothetical protein